MSEKTPEVTPEGKTTKAQAITSAGNVALADLRKNHLDEFNALKKAAVAERGFEWEPQPTAVQKARASVAALLRDNPSVRAELFSEIEAQVKGQETSEEATAG